MIKFKIRRFSIGDSVQYCPYVDGIFKPVDFQIPENQKGFIKLIMGGHELYKTTLAYDSWLLYNRLKTCRAILIEKTDKRLQ